MADSAPITLPVRLSNLSNSGLYVDDLGRLRDWADRPSYEARPALAGVQRKKKTDFSPAEERLLRLWCSAAGKQGVLVGSTVFEQLECLV